MIVRASTEIELPTDIGTLWTLRKTSQVARCAVMAARGEWELREIVDGMTRRARRCGRGAEAFAIAEEWRRRMVEDGWCQIAPGPPGTAASR